jgi:hypothetical protein
VGHKSPSNQHGYVGVRTRRLHSCIFNCLAKSALAPGASSVHHLHAALPAVAGSVTSSVTGSDGWEKRHTWTTASGSLVSAAKALGVYNTNEDNSSISK